jgi:hypothetical protein
VLERPHVRFFLPFSLQVPSTGARAFYRCRETKMMNDMELTDDGQLQFVTKMSVLLMMVNCNLSQR